MKYLLLSVVCVYSFSSQASLHKLAVDFLGNNADVKVAESQVDLAKLDVAAFELTRNTTLGWNSSYTDASLESFSAFAARFAGGAFRQPFQTTEHTLSLSKGFEWGGDLTFDNTYSEITVPGAQKILGFSQGLTYIQNIGNDFFGKNFKNRKEELQNTVGFASANSENSIQQSLIQLVQNYYNASLNKSLVKLQSEAKQRAEQRLRLIKRRVKDGLRQKVDRIQAEISLYQADEAVKSAKQNFTSALESLSTSVHREVTENEVLGLIDSSFKGTIQPSGQVENNQTLKALKSQVKASQSGLERADMSLLPAITLEAGVRNNNFDPATSEAISGGLFGQVNDEVRLALNVSWALGSQPERVEKTRALVNFNTNKLRKEKLQSDVVQSEKSIKDQIKLLTVNLDSAKSRIKLAKRALAEYNRLYGRGRADLDQLIQAEETLINTEINYVQYHSQRERLVHSLAFLYGSLRKFLVGAGE